MHTPPCKESLLEKNWIIHNLQEGITSVIRFVSRGSDGNYNLAVSRAIKSVSDNMYSRPEGRRHALERMETYFNAFRRAYLKRSIDRRKPVTVETKVPLSPDRKIRYRVTKTVFAVGPETVLNLHEMEVWSNTILPCIERELNGN